jgi:hypothetical protein
MFCISSSYCKATRCCNNKTNKVLQTQQLLQSNQVLQNKTNQVLQTEQLLQSNQVPQTTQVVQSNQVTGKASSYCKTSQLLQAKY